MIFDQVDIIKKSLSFFTKYTDRLDIILIENPSVNSKKIKSIINSFATKGLVKRHYVMSENITGNAFAVVLNNERTFISNHANIILSDGDITISDTNWLDEQLDIINKNKDIFACGVSLDMKNLPIKTFPDSKTWIPKDINSKPDYYEAVTGIHMLLMRSKNIIGFLNWIGEKSISFVDGNMHTYCYENQNMKWVRTKYAIAYHLTWDLYNNKNHPYTKFKLSKTFHDAWHHNRLSSFTITEY